MRSVTITLTERDARIFQQELDGWIAQQGSTVNAEARKVLNRVSEQLRYFASDEQERAGGARG